MATVTSTFRENTRSMSHQQRFQIPPTFAGILKEYTREVLREQPEDILSWSAQYFKRLALESDPLLARQAAMAEDENLAIEDPELEALSIKLARLFAEADDAQAGTLSPHLVKKVMMEMLGLSSLQARYILSADFVEIDEHGFVLYASLARRAINAVLYFQQSGGDFEEAEVEPTTQVHGMLQGEIEAELTNATRAADVERVGRLSFQQYRNVLGKVPIDFTRRDILMLCAEADVSSEGFVDLKQEVCRAFELLTQAQIFTAFDEQAL